MKILLFDVDGTLVNSGGAGRRALDRALEGLYGVKDGSKGVVLAGNTDWTNFRQALRAVTGRRPTKAEVERLMAAYLRALPAEVRRSVRQRRYRVLGGAKRLLARLARRDDVRLGLGTGNLELGARIKLRPSGLHRFFDFGGYGSDHADRARVLRLAARRGSGGRRVRGEDVFVVGDTVRDVDAGRRAGFRTLAVATGWDSQEDLRAARPDRLVADFRDAGTLIDWFMDGRGARRSG